MRFAKPQNPFIRPVAAGPCRHAFTLIELMAVIAIIAVLAGLIVGGVSVANRKAAEAKTKAQIAMLEIALDQYRQEFGYYPQTGGSLIEISKKFIKGDDPYGPYTTPRLHGLEKPNLINPTQPGIYYVDLNQFSFSTLDDNPTPSNDDGKCIDAWDTPYRYQCPGAHNAQTYDLWSNGVDDDPAVTGDDINNWSRN